MSPATDILRNWPFLWRQWYRISIWVRQTCKNLCLFVQNMVSLIKSLVKDSLNLLVHIQSSMLILFTSKMWAVFVLQKLLTAAFVLQKLLTIFYTMHLKIHHLLNFVLSFEQRGPRSTYISWFNFTVMDEECFNGHMPWIMTNGTFYIF